jgi:hypothetical protein
VTGTRFYTLGGVTLAARSSAGAVSYLTGDQQGTAAMSMADRVPASYRFRPPGMGSQGGVLSRNNAARAR